MKQDIQNIVEGNKLIAEFMESNLYQWWAQHPDTTFPAWHCEYHKDWALLMPVVEKIEDLRYCTEVSLFSCFIMAGDLLDSEMVIESHSNSKIKATYEAVVQFIQWYQQNQKPQ